MIWQNCELGGTISKATRDTKLWQTERGVLEIKKDTLAISIEVDDRRRGYVFHGRGKLLLDTIVETEEGAIGKPVEKELNNPFLMLGETEETQELLTKVSDEDLAEMGYENHQEFVAKAADLCNQFFRGRMRISQRFDENRGFIFAFQNDAEKLDILAAKASKLVYKAADIIFVSKENKVVLKSPSEVVCSSNGKSVIIQKGKSVIIKK